MTSPDCPSTAAHSSVLRSPRKTPHPTRCIGCAEFPGSTQCSRTLSRPECSVSRQTADPTLLLAATVVPASGSVQPQTTPSASSDFAGAGADVDQPGGVRDSFPVIHRQSVPCGKFQHGHDLGTCCGMIATSQSARCLLPELCPSRHAGCARQPRTASPERMTLGRLRRPGFWQ